MDKMIGIPSGWEEIAAFQMFDLTFGPGELITTLWDSAATKACFYIESYGHDWRVEE